MKETHQWGFCGRHIAISLTAELWRCFSGTLSVSVLLGHTTLKNNGAATGEEQSWSDSLKKENRRLRFQRMTVSSLLFLVLRFDVITWCPVISPDKSSPEKNHNLTLYSLTKEMKHSSSVEFASLAQNFFGLFLKRAEQGFCWINWLSHNKSLEYL